MKKLYTEEQVKEMLNKINSALPKRASLLVYMVKNITEYMTPIELPSDVEVGKIVLGNSPLMEHRDSGYFALGAMEYNKWLKEQILNQNK